MLTFPIYFLTVFEILLFAHFYAVFILIICTSGIEIMHKKTITKFISVSCFKFYYIKFQN